MLATQAVARIREWLDAPQVSVSDIFAARTVSALAAVLTGHEGTNQRLDAVAELYLEVTEMGGADVIAALETS